jgi:hypothetical protein
LIYEDDIEKLPKQQLDLIDLILDALYKENLVSLKIVKRKYIHGPLTASSLIFVDKSIFPRMIHGGLITVQENQYGISVANKFKFLIYVDTDDISVNMTLEEKDMRNWEMAHYLEAIFERRNRLKTFIDIIHAPGNGTVSLVTPTRFKTCNSSDFHTINTFNISTGEWKKKLEHYDKFSDWNGCPMTFSTSEPQGEEFLKEYDNVEYSHIKKLAHVLGEVFNFTLVLRGNDNNSYIYMYKMNNILKSKSVFLKMKVLMSFFHSEFNHNLLRHGNRQVGHLTNTCLHLLREVAVSI